MVKYQVQIKPINPITKSAMTNSVTFSGSTANTSSADYDCVLMYTKTNFPTSGSTTGWINPSELKNINHPVWCAYSTVDTVKKAMEIAKPLIQLYGLNNVQIVQVVPASTEIVFEEE